MVETVQNDVFFDMTAKTYLKERKEIRLQSNYPTDILIYNLESSSDDLFI